VSRFVIFLLATSVLLLRCSDDITAPGGSVLVAESPGTGGLEDRVMQLVNGHRDFLGCPRLRWDPELAGVALGYSVDMYERNFFGHVDPDGNGLLQRLRRAGIRFSEAAENLARGYREGDMAARVVEAWLASPDHRRNIENCGYRRTGLGIHNFYWTHLFAI
jgi:uncharacterized protein YkwD